MELTYRLFSPQYEFVADKSRYVAYYGGIGSGKTTALCLKAYLYMLEHAGAAGVVTAPTYPMLRDVTLPTFLSLVPPEQLSFSVEALRADLPNGSYALFRSASDPDRLRGPNLAFAAMDEASYSPRLAYDVLVGRLRQPGYDQQLWVVYTPNGRNWCYDEFGQERPDHAVYHCPTYRNPYLSTAYVESLKQQYGASEFYEQEVEGRYVSVRGLVYPEFDERVHVGEYPVNPNLPVALAIDFGYANPYAVLALQQDSHGRLYVVDEEYRVRCSDEEMVAVLRAKPYFARVSDAVADSAEPDRIRRLSELGLPIAPADKGEIVAGIAQVRALLQRDPVLNSPFLLVDRSCASLIREFGAYAYADAREERNINEAPIDANNHALSALRYYVVTRYVRSLPLPRAKRRRLAYDVL